ncbi:MAG: SRPBCC domain-containing protein [Thermomicrobiales bacterium]
MSKSNEVPTQVPEQITHEIVVDAPVARVWAIITEAEHIREWFAFDGARIDLRPGGALVMTWKEHGTFHARIERVEPTRRFAYRWAHLADQQPGDGNSTLVEFTLSPEGDGTRLRVVESGFRELDMPETEQAQWAADNIQGWTGGFTALQGYAQRVAA